jgi:hypothetical protein
MKRTKIYFFTGNQQTSPRCVLCFLISSLPNFFIFINVDLNLSTLFYFFVSQCCLFSGMEPITQPIYIRKLIAWTQQNDTVIKSDVVLRINLETYKFKI